MICNAHRIDLTGNSLRRRAQLWAGLDRPPPPQPGVLDPCTNLRLAGRILTTDYRAALVRWRPGQGALLHALSAYHHGSLTLDTAYLTRYHDRGGRSAAVDAADRPAPVGYHFISPVAVRVRQAAPRDDAVYRQAALNIAIR